MHLVHVRETQY